MEDGLGVLNLEPRTLNLELTGLSAGIVSLRLKYSPKNEPPG